MAPVTDSGIVHVTSPHSVADTLQRLLTLLETKGIALFTVVDHSGEAARVGLEMHPTKLVIFGNPKAGTPIMLAAPDAALDLPLKILIAETPEGKVRVSYNSPGWLQQRHNFPPDLLKNIAAIEQIAAAITT